MRIFCGLCRLQNLPITCTELNGRFTSEQSSINLQHESESSLEPFWLTNPCYFPFLSIDKQKWTTPNSLTQWRSTRFLIFFLLNKLAPGWVCLDFQHQFAHHPPRHHENSAILSGWKLQEHLALSPDDCGTN